MYCTLSSIIFPQNANTYSVLVINILIFEQKKLFVSLTSKIHCFVRPINAFHLCNLISRNSRPVYYLLYLTIYSASYFKLFYFLPNVNMVTNFLILNLCSSNRKTVAYSSLQLYIAKLIAGLFIINIWIFQHHVLVVHKFQRCT